MEVKEEKSGKASRENREEIKGKGIIIKDKKNERKKRRLARQGRR